MLVVASQKEISHPLSLRSHPDVLQRVGGRQLNIHSGNSSVLGLHKGVEAINGSIIREVGHGHINVGKKDDSAFLRQGNSSLVHLKLFSGQTHL